jgi:superfamily II helicase
MVKVLTARYGLIAYIKQIYNWWKVFTALYGLIAYIARIYNRGGKCLQRGTD